MIVLVTGANGILATNTIIELLGQGYRTVGLLRDKRKFLLPAHINLELIEGDLLDEEFLNQAVQKCDCVIHIAAETRQSLINYNEYYNINVVCTERLIQAALKYKLKRFVFISTANTLGYGTKDNPGHEECKIKEPFLRSYYVRSKLESEEIVLSKSKEMDVIVVNPTFLIGPYDNKPSSGRIILMSYGKKVVFYPPGGKNFVHVADVAKGIVSTLEIGKNGEKYLLANENLTYRVIFQKISAKSNSRVILIKIPKYLLLAIGIVGNILQYAGIKNEFFLTNMKILCTCNFYSNKKAKTELNTEFRSIDIALQEAIEWFKENKRIK